MKQAAVGVHPSLTDEQEKDLLRKCWYSHDARWFTAVAQEFGLETANRLNRRVCRVLGEAEMRRFAGALGITRLTTVQGLVEVMELAMRFFAPPPLTEFGFRVIDEHAYEAWLSRCFIHDNIKKAGIGPSYLCAAFARIQGWHEVLGLPLAEEPPALPCAMVQGRECRRVLTVQLPKA